MKKLFEFKAFDVINTPENQEFLNKVKKENPNEYSHFVSLIGNKGLQIAIDRYLEYDPNFILMKKREQKAKESRESKEKRKEEILIKHQTEIQMVNAILNNSELKNVLNYIKNNKNIDEYLKSYRAKKQYKNHLLELLNKPFHLDYELKHEFIIDSLNFICSFWFDDNESKIIFIKQYLNLSEKKLSYHISFFVPELIFSDSLSFLDNKKQIEFIEERNKHINKLGKFDINKRELYEIINNFSYALSENFYNEWKFKKDVSKYNL